MKRNRKQRLVNQAEGVASANLRFGDTVLSGE